MAAKIRDPRLNNAKERKPILIDRIDDFNSEIFAAVILPKEDGVITVSDDRSIRIWLKRETGKYWPSVCNYADSFGTSLFYHAEPRRLFVGLENGNIFEYAVGEDYNKMTLIKRYLAHQARVTNVYYSLEHDWVLSTSRDKYFAWHSTDNSRRVGSYNTNSWCTCLAYDTASKHCFVGDMNGNISFLKLTDQGCEFIANLGGHESGVKALAWDANRKFLFSGGFDKKVIVWDIGGQKGVTYDLEGHTDRVQAVIYSALTRQLISGSDDCKIVVWDMIAKRQETPQWNDSDDCEHCKRPFFWNVKSMWEQKTVGLRQHHCRRCGAAVCDACSMHRSILPTYGHEFEVRICDKCIDKITDEDKAPLATIHDTKHNIVDMSFDEARKILITVGTDRTIKVWDVSSILSL